MNIAGSLGRLPGAAILVPLLTGAVLGTVAGGHGALGPVTTALTTSALPLISVLMVCVGAQIDARRAAGVAGRAGLVLLGATVVPAGLILLYASAFGVQGIGGVSLLALLAVGLSSSYGLWAALAGRFGTSDDLAAGCLAAVINSGPFVPLLVIAAWHHDSGTLPWRLLLDAVAPLLAGVVIGHLLPTARPALGGVITPLLPVLSFALGWSIPLGSLLTATPAGLGIAVISGLVSGGIVAALWRRLPGRDGALGWAAGSCAANSGAMPALLVAADPRLLPHLGLATAQACVAVLASTILAAVLTARASRRATQTPSTAPQASPIVAVAPRWVHDLSSPERGSVSGVRTGRPGTASHLTGSAR